MAGPWYAQAFDELYLQLYAHRDEHEAERSIAWLATRVRLDGRRVLDLGCGAGRHLGCLARRGARAVGVDLSMALLAHAVRAAAGPAEDGGRSEPGTGGAAGGGRPMVVRGDMRRLPLAARSCDGALSMFTSLGYFETDLEHAAVLGAVAGVLRDGGFFLVDFLNACRVRDSLVPETTRRVGAFVVHEARRIDRLAGRVVKEITVRDATTDATVRRYRESVALWSQDELTARLAACGLESVDAAGDYDGRPFVADASPRLILLARKPAA